MKEAVNYRQVRCGFLLSVGRKHFRVHLKGCDCTPTGKCGIIIGNGAFRKIFNRCWYLFRSYFTHSASFRKKR